MKFMQRLERTLLLAATILWSCGCTGEPEATESIEQQQQQRIERANLMEDEVGK